MIFNMVGGAGGGSPTPPSRLPDGYKEIGFIVTNGSQYYDLGMRGNAMTKIEMRFKPTALTTGGKMLYGVIGTSADRNVAVQLYSASNVGRLRQSTGKGSSFAYAANVSVAIPVYTWHTLVHTWNTDGTNRVLTVDGEASSTTAGATFPTANNVYLFAYNKAGAATTQTDMCSIFCNYVKIYNGDALIRDFVPCYRESDGVHGFYDLAQGAFLQPTSATPYYGSSTEV